MVRFNSFHAGRGNPVQLDPQFGDELERLAQLLEAWSGDGVAKLIVAHKQIGQRHRSEAVKRAPVETGRMRNAIMTNVYQQPGAIITETGSNMKYAKFIEFGTKYIAGGAVKRLGTNPEITDAQAIHSWPAKDASAIDQTSHSIDAQGRLRTKTGRFASGGSQEQMPFLRPAWMVIKGWAIKRLIKALEPPKPKGPSGGTSSPLPSPSPSPSAPSINPNVRIPVNPAHGGGGTGRGFLGRTLDSVRGLGRRLFGRG